jgi:hypothetical protein
MKTVATDYTRPRSPDGRSCSRSQHVTLRARPWLTGSAPWPLVSRKEPVLESVWLTGAEIRVDIAGWTNRRLSR